MSSVKWRPFYLGLSVLTKQSNYISITTTPTVLVYSSTQILLYKNPLYSVGLKWKVDGKIIDELHHILFDKRKTLFGPPHFGEKLIEIQVTFLFHKHAPLFDGPDVWDILCWNQIYWSPDLLKSISYYILVVFVVALCWGPRLNVQFQPSIQWRKSVSVKLEPTMLQICLHNTSRTILLPYLVPLY